MVKVDFIDGRVRVFIPLDSRFHTNLDAVKCVGGGRYKDDPRLGKHHHFPMMRLPAILKAFPEAWLGNTLAGFMQRTVKAAEIKTWTDAPQPVGILIDLRPLQRVAVAFLSLFGRCILANDIGTGKTFIGIAWAHARAGLHKGKHGTLVVTKSAGKYKYESEIRLAVPGARTFVVEGREGPFPAPASVGWVILNYDLLAHRLDQIEAFGFETVIFSEGHKLKGSKAPKVKPDGSVTTAGTQRGGAALEIGKFIPNCMDETASLIPNRNAELFPQLQILGYVTVDDYFPWHLRYCGHTETTPDGTVKNFPATKIRINKRGTMRWDFSQSSFSDELHESIAPFTFSKTKKEAIPERTKDPTFDLIPVNISNMSEYREAEAHFLQWVDQEKGADAVARAKKALAITKRTALLQLATEGMTGALVDELETYAAAREKVVIFSRFKKHLPEVVEKYPGISVSITGDETAKQKDEAAERFQKNPDILFCFCTVAAGGESVTLTAAHNVIFDSLPDTPKEFEQAYGRVDRIGQEHDVLVKVLLARRTVVLDVAKMIHGKALNIDKVVTGADWSPNSNALRAILQKLVV